MARSYVHRIGFADGVKPGYNPVAIPKTAIWEARNADVDDVGVLRVRPGSTSLSGSMAVGGLKGAISAFGDIVNAYGGSLYRFNTATKVNTLIKADFLADTDVSMELWAENNAPVVYLHDGAGLWRSDGTTCNLVAPYTPTTGQATNMLRKDDGTQDLASGPAKGKVALFRHGLASRMAIAYGNSLFLSAAGNPAYFPSDQIIQLPDDGGTIVALSLTYGALIIYRDKDIWAFIGDDVTSTGARLVMQDSSVGCKDPRSITDVPGVGQMFLGPDNIYALVGVSAIENQYRVIPMGDDVIPYLRRALATDAVGTFFDREYLLSFPSAIEPERIFRYKAGKKAWYIDAGPVAKHYIKHDGKLYFSTPTDGRIGERSLSHRQDDTAGIPLYAAFCQERLSQGPAKIRKIFVYVNSRETLQHFDASVIADGVEIQTVQLQVSAQSGADFAIGKGAIGISRIGRTNEITVYEGRINLRGTFAQVQINAKTPNEDIGIIGYSLEFVGKNKMKGSKKGVVRGAR